jgi:hypothetical protein
MKRLGFPFVLMLALLLSGCVMPRRTASSSGVAPAPTDSCEDASLLHRADLRAAEWRDRGRELRDRVPLGFRSVGTCLEVPWAYVSLLLYWPCLLLRSIA